MDHLRPADAGPAQALCLPRYPPGGERRARARPDRLRIPGRAVRLRRPAAGHRPPPAGDGGPAMTALATTPQHGTRIRPVHNYGADAAARVSAPVALLGEASAAWPAVSLVGSYELLVWIIGTAAAGDLGREPAVDHSGPQADHYDTSLQLAAARVPDAGAAIRPDG